MTNKLIEICGVKREDVARRKAASSVATLHARAAAQTPPRGFRRALDAAAASGFGLIAEVKKTRRPMPPPMRPAARPACRS